jgi:hypothetical protein
LLYQELYLAWLHQVLAMMFYNGHYCSQYTTLLIRQQPNIQNVQCIKYAGEKLIKPCPGGVLTHQRQFAMHPSGAVSLFNDLVF